jgi:hypothetical protein
MYNDHIKKFKFEIDAEDVKESAAIDVENEMINSVADSIRAEIDKQVIDNLVNSDRTVYIDKNSFYRYERNEISGKYRLHKFTGVGSSLVKKELADSKEDLKLYNKLKKLQTI